MSNTVLIIDGGARGHALSRAYEKSRHVQRIIVAPGNDFIAFRRTKEVIVDRNCNLNDPQSLLKIAQIYNPDLIDVAQDDALASGTVDLLKEHGFKVFGPTREAARIEWDKNWSKEFMKRHDIPTAEFMSFTSEAPAIEYVTSHYRKYPSTVLFIKATGLCAGKGALRATSLDEAISCIKQMKTFGTAGETFLIEEGLFGKEFSSYAISDGTSYKVFHPAQDHKRVNTFDTGDQTGGMGAVSPTCIATPYSSLIEETMIKRTIKGMETEGIPYTGILYIGGIVVNGKPYVIEFNARWGDPECHVVLPSIDTDYFELITAALDKRLDNIDLQINSKQRVCVVGALRGYPGESSTYKGSRIFGLVEAMDIPGVHVLGAGMSLKAESFVANGGRLFSIVGEGESITEARQNAYAAISTVHIEGNNLHYRTDIGWNDVEAYYHNNIS